MARLASQEKMEYYPTPEKAVERSLQKIKSTVPVKALDPCAGDGRTLKMIKEKFNAEVFGIELDRDRSNQVVEIVGADNCLSQTDALLDARITAQGFNLIFNNPPYDWERGYGDKRLEHTFIERYSSTLVEGGIMVLVIGKSLFQSYYRMEELLKIIFKNFAVFDFFEMTEDTQFGQYVVFLRKAKLLPLISILKVLGSNDELDRKLENSFGGGYSFQAAWDVVIEMSQALRPKTDHNDFSLTVEAKPLKLFKSVAITEEMFDKAIALNNKVINMFLEETKPMDIIETLVPLRNSQLPSIILTGILDGIIRKTNIVIKGMIERYSEVYEDMEIKADKNGKEKEVLVAKEINKFRAKLKVMNLKTKEVIDIN